MDHDHLPLAAEVDDALHEVEVDAGAGRVVRERDDEHPRLGPADVVGGGEAVEELLGELVLRSSGWASERIGTWRRSAPANSGP